MRAYTSSAKLAVEAAGICSVQQVCRLGVTLDYTYLSRFQQMASESISEGDGGFVIVDINYGEKVRLELITPEENLEKLTGMIANMTAGTAIIEEPETALEKV